MSTENNGKGKFWLDDPDDYATHESPDNVYYRENNTHGLWAPISCKDHAGFGLMVWRMEGDSRSPNCETRANQVINMLNRHDKLVEVIKSFMNPESNLDQLFAEAQALVDEAEKE